MALFRKIGMFFKNFFTSFSNLFSKKASSTSSPEPHTQESNLTTVLETEITIPTIHEQIQTVVQNNNISLLENDRERLINESYNPELLLDGVHVLQDANLLNDSNLDKILSKIAPWDAARAIVALHSTGLTEQLDLALEK